MIKIKFNKKEARNTAPPIDNPEDPIHTQTKVDGFGKSTDYGLGPAGDKDRMLNAQPRYGMEECGCGMDDEYEYDVDDNGIKYFELVMHDPESLEVDDSVLYEKKDRCYHLAKQKYDVFPSAYACVPENSSQALTRTGWKYANELIIGEEILTHNMYKDVLEFKPILNLYRYKDAKTLLVRSGNNGFIFECTDNHKWVVKLPELKSKNIRKHERVNDFALIETSELLKNKFNKLLTVSAPYNDGSQIKKEKIYKYGDNWVQYVLDIDSGQRQSWLFSAIIYDGNQVKTQRMTENKNNINDLEWEYDGKRGRQTFGFKQKDIMHRDAFLLSAFLNNGLVTWKKHNKKDIYSCNYSSDKRFKNTSNFKQISENTTDVWCPETENQTWVMKQETLGRGIITITGNSGFIVRCRKGKVAKKKNEAAELEEGTFDKEKKQGLHGWFARKGGKGKSQGWVDCNTCRTDPKTGRKKCKSCGRQEGEKRSKYPACRPTPSACNKAGTSKKKSSKRVSWKKEGDE